MHRPVKRAVQRELEPVLASPSLPRVHSVLFASLPCPHAYRPVKRAVQRELETVLAKALLRGDFVEEDVVLVEAGERGLVLRKGDKQQAGMLGAPQPAVARG